MDGWTWDGIYSYSAIQVQAIVQTWEAKELKYIQCRHTNKQLCFPVTHPKSFRTIQHHVWNSLYLRFPNFFPWINPHIIFHIPRNACYVNVHRSEVVQEVIAVQLPLHYFQKIYVRKDDAYICACVFMRACVSHDNLWSTLCSARRLLQYWSLRYKKIRRHFGLSAVFQDLHLFMYSTSANRTPSDILRTLV